MGRDETDARRYPVLGMLIYSPRTSRHANNGAWELTVETLFHPKPLEMKEHGARHPRNAVGDRVGLGSAAAVAALLDGLGGEVARQKGLRVVGLGGGGRHVDAARLGGKR